MYSPVNPILDILRSECSGTQWRMGGEVKGKLANGVDGQYSHATSEHGVSSITTADAHTSVASSRLNWRPRRFKWTRPFRRKTKSGFCACAITFQTQPTAVIVLSRLSGCILFKQNVSQNIHQLIGSTRWRLLFISYNYCSSCIQRRSVRLGLTTLLNL